MDEYAAKPTANEECNIMLFSFPIRIRRVSES